MESKSKALYSIPDQRCRVLIARGQIASEKSDLLTLKRTVAELSTLRHFVGPSMQSFAEQQYTALKLLVTVLK